MRIFVTGATGVIGRRLVPLLAANGHTVVGTARAVQEADALRAAGADPVVLDDGERREVLRLAQVQADDEVRHREPLPHPLPFP